MSPIYDHLAPLTDWIPPDILALARVEVWWLGEFVLALLALLVVARILRAILRSTSSMFHRPVVWDVGLEAPLTPGPLESPPILMMYQRPAWVRLVVLAPVGRRPIDLADVGPLLRHLGPDLERPAVADQPAILLWPTQLSTAGFRNTFHRLTPTGEPAGDLSHWVFLAGRARVGKLQVFLGIALWMREPSSLGRLDLEPEQWRDVLRLASSGD